MSVTLVKPGLQSTIQSRPRAGLRHQGVPSGGAADPLSLALANRLVGNAWDAPAIEAALLGPALRFDRDCAVAVTGAIATVTLNGTAVGQHRSVFAREGDELVVGACETGARVYVAVAGGFAVPEVLGSAATSLQAGFGGFEGRAFAAGDVLETVGGEVSERETPAEFRPPMATSWALRACDAAETPLLQNADTLFDTNWVVDRRADRMGLRLDGPTLSVSSDGRMPSAAVFPGTVQCPEDGAPYILSADAGTVGGYPRVAQVARLDRHILGQLRPGDHVRLLRRDPDDAVEELRDKIDYWREWLPAIAEIF
ncbi:MAG: biotin-dependent carboxyltransferase family protein [Gammaproteobacteria bacterium]|nr:biotin-dependent carboxyltransferase family protein [Gammaproteobacteria bacterium]NNF48270.1 biotin-dependent carboxyltransferase family protein [Woeseiaceae bacterium]MBT8093883.1 biotin-dependent carboxyltransferase family protein [Gammaproteobacteria bacterium]MBT8104453.1 biotin-dependent carboxyltransferase family protein [Gammaproteobacteria bacterium]NNK24469.1 biotin-dependent carboxyltransferase family protein [Woeseiaceae bacterium]